jgi:hypothetical protein
LSQLISVQWQVRQSRQSVRVNSYFTSSSTAFCCFAGALAVARAELLDWLKFQTLHATISLGLLSPLSRTEFGAVCYHVCAISEVEAFPSLCIPGSYQHAKIYQVRIAISSKESGLSSSK